MIIEKEMDELKQNDAYAQSLINGIPDLLFVLNQNGVFLDYRGEQNATLVSPDYFLGRHYREILPGDVADQMEQALQELFQTGKAVEIGYSLPLGGGVQYFSARMVLFGPDKVIVVSRNVTDQKRTEEALKKSREQFELAVTGSNDGIWDWDLRDHSLYLSPKWKEQLGYADHELENLFSTFEGLLHPEDRPVVMAYVGRYLKGEFEPYQIEFRMRHKDGSWRWILGRGSAIKNGEGVPYRMAGSHTDITDRKQAEEALQSQSRLQRLLMEISSTYINLPLDRLDETIRSSLGELGEFVGADRVYLFDYDYNKQVSFNTHEWCAEGIPPQIEDLQEVPFSMTREWLEVHRKGEAMYIPDVNALSPSDSLREVLEPQGIKSLLAVPMMDGDDCLGFVGFDSVRRRHSYTENEQRLLTVFAQMLVSVRKRGKTTKRPSNSAGKRQIEPTMLKASS
jgi:PAS domain S-box-containing protein